MALNGLISVPSESSSKLPTEVLDELASIEDAGLLELHFIFSDFVCNTKYFKQNLLYDQ